MLSKNLIRECVAGAGKTYDLCSKALELAIKNLKVLIVTYTNNGVKNIVDEIQKQNSGIVHPNIFVMTWYCFLIRELIKPYQRAITSRINYIKSVDFTEIYGKVNKIKTGNMRRYLKGENIRSNYCSELALIINDITKGASLKRLQEAFNAIFIDEVQDLAGRDIDLLNLFLDSKMKCVFVGDNLQSTFSTHNSRTNKKYTGINIWKYFEMLDKEKMLKIENVNITKRFNKDIADFANKVICQDIIETNEIYETGHDGVFVISQEDVIKYSKYFKTVNLKFNANTHTYGLDAINFGASKGMTFDRCIVFANNPIKEFLKGKDFDSFPKYYVAFTRAKYSIAIVLEEFFIPPNFCSYELIIGNEKITCAKFNPNQNHQ